MRSLIILASLAALPALAEETRGLDAHEHGAGAFNIAVEGATVLMELEAPGADIVGFEHRAVSAGDRAAIDAAVARLAKPLDLFIPPPETGCVVSSARVELISENDEHHDEDHAHGDDQKNGEHHADHDAKEDKDHAHDRAAHDGHGDDSHTEFHAEYALTCADPAAIRSLEFAYFSAFPAARELSVQMISARGSRGFEVTRDAPRLDLAGAI